MNNIAYMMGMLIYNHHVKFVTRLLTQMFMHKHTITCLPNLLPRISVAKTNSKKTLMQTRQWDWTQDSMTEKQISNHTTTLFWHKAWLLLEQRQIISVSARVESNKDNIE